MANRGRPTKYTDEMPKLAKDYLSAGNSVTEFCAEYDIDKTTFYLWVKTHPDFSYAFIRGKNNSQAYWEKWLKNNLDNPKANGPLTKLYFANRFGWSDKKKIKQDHLIVATEVQEVRDAREAYKESFEKEY